MDENLKKYRQELQAENPMYQFFVSGKTKRRTPEEAQEWLNTCDLPQHLKDKAQAKLDKTVKELLEGEQALQERLTNAYKPSP